MDNKPNTPISDLGTRREFIKKSSTAAAVVATGGLLGCKTPVYGQSTAPSSGRVMGANDRVSIAVIGVGVGIGQNHLTHIHKSAADNNTVLSAACDLFDKRRAWAKKEASLTDADIYSEYRKLLERKDIDAVLIATHDVWHDQISADALKAGKHVYCEKPMSRYLGEAFEVYDTTVKNPKLVYQIGSQGCSAGGWKKCGELINQGKIGTLVWAQGYYCRNSIKGEWNEAPFDLDADSTGKTVDWATWQGNVKNKLPEFSNDHFHRWRKYYPYCAGLLGDFAPHRMHPLMLASGNPEFPARVTCIGTRNVHADKECTDTVERDIPEHQQLLVEFPSGFMITLTVSSVNARTPGFVIYGHKATLLVGDGGNRIDLAPEAKFADDIDPMTIDGLQQEDIRMHEKNFFNAVRGTEKANAPADLAVKVQTVLSLAEMSNRLNMTCLFDEKTRTITNGDGKKIPAITYGTLPLS